MQLRAQKQSLEDTVVSAINCGKLGISLNVKQFNWMS